MQKLVRACTLAFLAGCDAPTSTVAALPGGGIAPFHELGELVVVSGIPIRGTR